MIIAKGTDYAERVDLFSFRDQVHTMVAHPTAKTLFDYIDIAMGRACWACVIDAGDQDFVHPLNIDEKDGNAAEFVHLRGPEAANRFLVRRLCGAETYAAIFEPESEKDSLSSEEYTQIMAALSGHIRAQKSDIQAGRGNSQSPATKPSNGTVRRKR